ncbi:MAG: MBL fold metallo-hydrolase, partial [Candidatus Dadabacteria bacterium]|nr:MBL fold metallo-hydrolase [Candidatus Dadabacteria bacterium]
HWTGQKCIKAVRDIVEGESIDLMIISHSDSDHLGDADDILSEYDVSNIVRPGFDRWDTANWKNFNEAVGKEAMYGATVINLATLPLDPGEAYVFGDATVTLVA